MAAVALGYLALAAARPDLLAHLSPAGMSPSGTEAVAELRNTVESLSRDVAELRGRVGEISLASERLTHQVSTLTSADAGPTNGETSAATLETGSGAVLRLDSAPVNGPITKTGGSLAKPATAPAARSADAKVINSKPGSGATQPSAIETGSVKPSTPEVPPFGAAIVKPTAKPVGLQIASGSSLDSLRLSWSLLSETHAGSLKNLEPRYSTSVDANGLVYNLMAGPVKSEAEAKKMCKDLAAKAIPCKIVGDFSGAAL